MGIEYKKMSIEEFLSMSMDEIMVEFGVHNRNLNEKYFINAMAGVPGYVHPSNREKFREAFDKLLQRIAEAEENDYEK